jgi:hypothetical protein
MKRLRLRPVPRCYAQYGLQGEKEAEPGEHLCANELSTGAVFCFVHKELCLQSWVCNMAHVVVQTKSSQSRLGFLSIR